MKGGAHDVIGNKGQILGTRDVHENKWDSSICHDIYENTGLIAFDLPGVGSASRLCLALVVFPA